MKYSYPGRFFKMSCIRGKGYVFRLSSQKSKIHCARPSFFGMIKVGSKAHSVAPILDKTPNSTNRSNSFQKTSKWLQGIGYGRPCMVLASGSSSNSIFLNGYLPSIPEKSLACSANTWSRSFL